MLLYTVQLSFAQLQNTNNPPLVIRHADQMIGYETDRGPTRELQGNVQLMHGDVIISCMKARQELTTGRAELSGSVIITQGTLRMRMDRGEYLSLQRRAKGIGNVIIEDGASALYAPHGEYFFDTKKAIFYDRVRAVDSGTVVLADSLAYYRETQERLAWGNVSITFTAEKMAVSGDSAYQDVVHRYARVCGNSTLIQADTVEGDTLFLRSQCFALADSSLHGRLLVAWGKVRFLRGALSGCGDSLVMQGENAISLYHAPVVWADSSQLTGSVIYAQLVQRRLQQLIAIGNATLGIIEDSMSTAPHQLVAERILLRFEGDTLRYVFGSGNVKTLYLNRSDTGEPDGITRVASDSIAITLSNGQIQRTSWYGNVQSEYVPEHLLRPEERYLREFQWFAETKPRRDQLLTRGAILDR
ncbi:MAG: hypothetical protein NZ481_00850 [Candidatus Kapabacteria bacterium]|nr:hypothetical protein [Candidatus Kapabacteria bacterium]